MKLIIHSDAIKRHSDIVSCIDWTSNHDLFSISDDRKIVRWSKDGEYLEDIATFQPPVPKGVDPATVPSVFVTDMHWFPTTTGKSGASSDIFVVGATDGKFYICSRNGRVEKVVEAHKGAVLSLRWNPDGTALVTGGEDGHLKVWSRNGMLRTALAQTGYPIYSVTWSPDSDHILLTNGRNLIIKPLQPSMKPTQWKAHDGIILKVDWNLVNNLLISAGEDKKYKVWDSFGRQIYCSAPHDHPITSVAWNPSGEMFAVGSFNTVRVCDKLGWSYALGKPSTGSILNITWTSDGTQFACAGSDGSVLFGHLIGRRYEWRQYEVTVEEENKILVHDVVQNSDEHLEFRDRVIRACIGFSHLIVATSSQCYIYSDKNWNTPCVIDLPHNGRVTCIQQSADYLVVVDTYVGIQIFSYDGRIVCQPKYPGLRPEFITPTTISIANDTLAIKDHTNEKAIYLFEVSTGRLLEDKPLLHTQDVWALELSQADSPVGRQLAIIDKNRDLFLCKTIRRDFKKLGTMVDTIGWNDQSDILFSMMDGKAVVWYYPNTVFVDEDIAPLTRTERDASSFGKNCQCISFVGTQCTVRRADGAIVTVSSISPFPGLLHEFARKKQWEEAIRLCRHVQQKELWACLAVMSIYGQDLNTAEVAYAAIDEVHKVQYVTYVRDIPTAEGRAAQLALLRRQPKEAENILISANMTYRAIRMWIDLFEWDRALDLAVKYKTHVDTVLYFRQQYLSALNQVENNKRILQYSQSVSVEEEKIRAKIEVEETAEKHGRSGR